MAINKTQYPKCYKELGTWITKQSQLHNQPAEMLQAIPVDNMVDIVFHQEGKVIHEFLQDHYI